MFITDINRNLIEIEEPSLDLAYSSIFNKDIAYFDLIAVKSKTSLLPIVSLPGELFYSSAFLMGVALSKNYKKESYALRDEAASLISLYEDKRWSDCGYFNTLLCVWLSSLTDFKITFENYVIENLINLNVKSDNYNNIYFNLFMTRMVVNDLKKGEFKKNMNALLKSIEKDGYKIPESIQQLRYPDGVFCCPKREQYYHFLRPVMLDTRRDRMDMTALSGSGRSFSGNY